MPVNGLFVCGGKVSHGTDTLLSLRHIFLACPEISNLRVALAEDVFSRLTQFSKHYDLLTIERHIAYLTRTILLFSESPGSIAELGAFSVLKECASKLCVVLDHPMAAAGSFIYDGPIAYMCRTAGDVPNDSKQLQVFDWPKVPRCTHSPSCGDTKFDFQSPICKEYINCIYKNLSEELARPPSPATRSMSETKDYNIPHLALLIVDLIRIARCVTRADIAWMLQTIGRPLIGQGSKGELDYLLALVESLGFVSTYLFGKPFYCTRINTPTVSYKYKKATKAYSFEPCMQATWDHLRHSPLVSINKKAYETHLAKESQRATT